MAGLVTPCSAIAEPHPAVIATLRVIDAMPREGEAAGPRELVASLNPDRRPDFSLLQGTPESGLTPLAAAVLNQNNRLVRAILEAEGDAANLGTGHGCTPLFFAAITGDKDSMSLLLESGAKVNEATTEVWDQDHIDIAPQDGRDHFAFVVDHRGAYQYMDLEQKSSFSNERPPRYFYSAQKGFALLSYKRLPNVMVAGASRVFARYFCYPIPAGTTPLCMAALYDNEEAMTKLVIHGGIAAPELNAQGQEKLERVRKKVRDYYTKVAGLIVRSTDMLPELGEIIARYSVQDLEPESSFMQRWTAKAKVLLSGQR